MENTDRELIHKVIKTNAQLRRLYQEHEVLEDKLSCYESRTYLTTAEELELKRLKRRKLWGVDRMMEMISERRM